MNVSQISLIFESWCPFVNAAARDVVGSHYHPANQGWIKCSFKNTGFSTNGYFIQLKLLNGDFYCVFLYNVARKAELN